MDALFPKVPTEPGRVVLKVDRLTREGVFTDVSFDVRRGEIVALAGLVGAGRTEVARAIFGIDRWDAGAVEVDGRSLRPGSPTAAMAAGVGLVPEDRRQQGLIMDFSIERNIALASLDGIERAGLIPRGAERRFAKDWALRLQLKYGKLTSPVWTLSGGNQQKAVLAKWLARRPKLLIVDEPTRGIDVGTKAEVHRLLSELASQGIAVLMISSELPEVLGMADRVVVLFEGQEFAAQVIQEIVKEARQSFQATVTLAETESLISRLSETKGIKNKTALLTAILYRATPLEATLEGRSFQVRARQGGELVNQNLSGFLRLRRSADDCEILRASQQ